ncbi:hypothetical protein F4778DRAFT_53760 [Xylariomycetidae sp. FL2044]|nr:hypothetical protein F4778DRAFT_53760 [Xylariomycetidae sp. FL2044]
MKLQHLLLGAVSLIHGAQALNAPRGPLTSTVTVTAAKPSEARGAESTSTVTVVGPVHPPDTAQPAPSASPAPLPATASAPHPPAPSGASGPKCGKGYTYCGYMLTSNGHNFAVNEVSKAYCASPELCPGGKPKTDISEAVFVCMEDQPSNVTLLCACEGKCLNDAAHNNIAQCDKPCASSC